MAKKFNIEINRWIASRGKHGAFVSEKKTLDGGTDAGFSICAKETHEHCTHRANEGIVLRNQQITAIAFYPSIDSVVVYTKSRTENGEAE